MLSTGKPSIKETGIPTKTRSSAEHEGPAADHFPVAQSIQIG